jgi:hypothetical protein
MKTGTINVTSANSNLTSSLSQHVNKTDPYKETRSEPPKLSRLLSITELLRLLEEQTKLSARLFKQMKTSQGLDETLED